MRFRVTPNSRLTIFGTSHKRPRKDFEEKRPQSISQITNSTSHPLVVIGHQKCSIHRLHTTWTSEGAHQPVVDALDVVDVHAGKVAHRVADIELNHADDTLSVLLAAIKGAGRQVLD